jgi:pantoate--beta-alanine ligase
MTSDLNLDTQIVVCPIVREADGLAMSSRNAYLKADERRAATALHRALAEAKKEIEAGERDALRLAGVVRKTLSAEAMLSVDYAEIVGAETFEPVTRLRRGCLALLAVYVGKTRLIDNMLIEEQDGVVSVTL